MNENKQQKALNILRWIGALLHLVTQFFKGEKPSQDGNSGGKPTAPMTAA